MNFRDEKWLALFGSNLAKVRDMQGFTQEKLAYASGLSLSQVARIETGKTNPTLCTIIVIAHTLKIEPSELLNIRFK
ncbi:MAG: helix-turn-helix transcriptional regulator [Chitinophagales bacterium]